MVSLPDKELTRQIISCAFKVHNALGAGFLEKVYENALALELRSSGFEATQQAPIKVYYRKQCVGEFIADLIINNSLICELKAVSQIQKIHEVQLVNYLNATGYDTGLLLNFGNSVQIKRKFKSGKHDQLQPA